MAAAKQAAEGVNLLLRVVGIVVDEGLDMIKRPGEVLDVRIPQPIVCKI